MTETKPRIQISVTVDSCFVLVSSLSSACRKVKQEEVTKLPRGGGGGGSEMKGAKMLVGNVELNDNKSRDRYNVE